jgi:hypothetical protein
MILELLIIFFIITVYFLFYIEYKVNKYNNIYEYDKELTRQNINNEILIKTPFYFDGSHLNFPLSVSNYTMKENDKNNKFKEYNMVESELLLLKPYIKSEVSDKLYSIKKDGQIGIHKNRESINYYFVRDGSAEIFLIHPKFRDNFETDKKSTNKDLKDYIGKNEHFHKIECSKGTIVYVPNDWLIYIQNLETVDCWIEKLSYSTIINKFMLYFKKKT